jgi:hypothetical protein
MMAKLTLDPVFKEAHGKLGNYVLRRAHNGQMTLIKLADMSKVKWSKAQKEHRRRFKQAVAYAKAAMAEPTVRARYEKEAARRDKRPFDLAVSDYFKDRNLLAK